MPSDARIWRIQAEDRLVELTRTHLDLEERIEKWLEQDISILSNVLLVIGRQVTTDYGGVIDLLCLDRIGDAVIVELKRDKTPRDITAQTLDYASWVEDLSNERITEIADQYLGERGSLEQAFEQQFGEELPETLNGQHRMLIVASEVDPSTERIINYLSDTYGVDINAASFQYFRYEDDQEFLARVFVIDPSQVEQSTRRKGGSKRKPNLTYEELEEIADEKGVGDLYHRLVEGLEPVFDYTGTTRTTIFFVGILDGHRRTVFNIEPGASSEQEGLFFRAYIDRLVDYFKVDKESLLAIFPSQNKIAVPWEGAGSRMRGFFETSDDIARFLSSLANLRV